MRILIDIDRDLAITAIAYTLDTEGPVKSRKAFMTAIKGYMEFYGGSCKDPHDTEHNSRLDEATEICDKYFKD